MDITLTNESKRTYFKVEPTLASILCELNLAAPYHPPAPPEEKAGWSVGAFISSGRRNITVRCDGSSTYWFTGPPERISEFEKNLPPSAGKCPENVLAEYAAQYVPYVSENA